jgi:hypothetical protein
MTGDWVFIILALMPSSEYAVCDIGTGVATGMAPGSVARAYPASAMSMVTMKKNVDASSVLNFVINYNVHPCDRTVSIITQYLSYFQINPFFVALSL